MDVDIGNALSGSLGLTRSELESLDERVADAHERIETARAAEEFGYAALELPVTCPIDRIEATVESVRERLPTIGNVVTVGIGGSALGAATVADALAEDADCYALDNTDPAWIRRQLDGLDLERTVTVVVSRSGTTAETLANFAVVRGAMEEAGVDWTDRTVVVTGEAGPLRRLADDHGLVNLPVPDGAPGRFSVLSPVGLLPPALAGVDVRGLLRGGARGRDALAGSLFETPAYAYGAIAYALAERGAAVNAVMPYAESLDRFAEWTAQLWAESLGKDGRGQTPVRAMGVTDQHSQLQLYRAGPADKLVTLVTVDDRPTVSVPEPDAEELDFLRNTTLGELTDAEFRATEASLAASNRENVRVTVDRVAPEPLGELLYGFEAACICYGELAGVETFTQPAVEWGKRAAHGLLAGEDTPETELVREKRRLVVSGDDSS